MKEKIISALMSGVVIKFAGVLVSITIPIYITLIFGVRGVGVFGIFMTLVNLFGLLTKSGSDVYFLKKFANHPQRGEDFLNVGVRYVLINFFFMLPIFFLVMPLLKEMFPEELGIGGVYIPLILSVILFSLNSLFLSYIRAKGYIKLFYFISFILFFIFFVISLYVFNTFQTSLVNITISIFFSYFLINLILILHIRSIFLKSIFNKINIKFHFRKLKKMSPFFLISSLSLLMNFTDTLMVGYFMTVDDVGIYYMMAKISMLVTIPSVAIVSFIAPKLSKSHFIDSQDSVFYLLRESLKLILISSSVILIMITLLAEDLLTIIDEKYLVGYYSLVILSIAQFVNSFVGLYSQYLVLTNLQNTFATILLKSALLNIFLNIFMIPAYGVNGASIATLVSFSLMFFLSVFQFNKIKKTRDNLNLK